MTDWEQRQLFDRLDRILDGIQKLVENKSMVVGVDSAREGTKDTTISFVFDESQKDDSVKASVAKADRDRYNAYKLNGGELKWNEWRRMDKESRNS